MVGKNERKHVSFVVKDVIYEASFRFGVFDIIYSDRICKAFGVVESDGSCEFVLKFVVKRVLLFVSFEAVVFLSLGEENEVTWIAEV